MPAFICAYVNASSTFWFRCSFSLSSLIRYPRRLSRNFNFSLSSFSARPESLLWFWRLGILGIWRSAERPYSREVGGIGRSNRRPYRVIKSAYLPTNWKFREFAGTNQKQPILQPVQTIFILVVWIKPIASSGPVTSYNLRLLVIFKMSSLPTQTSPSFVLASDSASSIIMRRARSIERVLLSSPYDVLSSCTA